MRYAAYLPLVPILLLTLSTPAHASNLSFSFDAIVTEIVGDKGLLPFFIDTEDVLKVRYDLSHDALSSNSDILTSNVVLSGLSIGEFEFISSIGPGFYSSPGIGPHSAIIGNCRTIGDGSPGCFTSISVNSTSIFWNTQLALVGSPRIIESSIDLATLDNWNDLDFQRLFFIKSFENLDGVAGRTVEVRLLVSSVSIVPEPAAMSMVGFYIASLIAPLKRSPR